MEYGHDVKFVYDPDMSESDIAAFDSRFEKLGFDFGSDMPDAKINIEIRKRCAGKVEKYFIARPTAGPLVSWGGVENLDKRRYEGRMVSGMIGRLRVREIESGLMFEFDI